VNLSNLPNLRVFSLYTITCRKTMAWNIWNPPLNAPSFTILHDINIVLGTIPESNRITNLWFDFLTIDRLSFDEFLNDDWVGMFNEIIRIGGVKPLELELKSEVCSNTLPDEHTGEEDDEFTCALWRRQHYFQIIRIFALTFGALFFRLVGFHLPPAAKFVRDVGGSTHAR
jgi:hypothetical protein